MENTIPQLRPEVAERYELSDAGHTRLFVPRLGYEVDLTSISLAEAGQLLALPGGFAWLRLREVVEVAAPTPLRKARRKRVSKARREE